jgi:anti-anti-sigma regulatory factor
MESLLQRIVDTGSSLAIIDITGVPTVDTLVAQHLLKTVAATRLMGADCIISGIRPQIAQTIVHLGVDLGEVTTKATLADAFASRCSAPALARAPRPRRDGADDGAHPDPEDGRLPAGHDPGRHARPARDALQDDLTRRIVERARAAC